MSRLIRSAVLNNYVELSRSLGLDPYRMITACGLPAACLDDPDTKVPLASVIKLLEQSALKSGKPDFGLRLAENRTLANVGALALLVREQPSVRKALDTLAGYMFLHSEAFVVRIIEQDDLVIVDVIIDAGRPVPMRQAIELFCTKRFFAMVSQPVRLQRLGVACHPIAVTEIPTWPTWTPSS